VAEVLPKLVRGETIERAFLGIVPLSVTDEPERAAAAGWTRNYGVLVGAVVEDSAADTAGLRAGDVVVRIDGLRMDSAYHLVETLGRMLPQTTIGLGVWRSGQESTVEVTLGRRGDG
jgi:S1-C subfamily serine protease